MKATLPDVFYPFGFKQVRTQNRFPVFLKLL